MHFRTEFKALVNFIQSKGIKIKRISHMEAGADTSGAEADLVASSGAVDDGSSSEDDDFIAKDEMEPDEEFDEVRSPSSVVCARACGADVKWSLVGCAGRRRGARGG